MPVKYLGGSLYYVIFIDDYSRKTWLYLLKTKDEVFNTFHTLLVVEPDYFPDSEVLCFSAVFIPHEDFTPQKYVHSSTQGSAEGGYPLYGVRGAYPPGWGFGGKDPKGNIAL
jgi:hypothetical protein